MCVFGREKVYLASLKSGKDCLALKTMGGAGGGGVLQAETRMKDIQAQGRGERAIQEWQVTRSAPHGR